MNELYNVKEFSWSLAAAFEEEPHGLRGAALTDHYEIA